MVAAGGRRPQLSQASQLKDLVVPPDSQLLKVALNAATAAGCVALLCFRSPCARARTGRLTTRCARETGSR